MPISAIVDKLEDVPEQYRDLYSERNGKFELTGIQGIKTDADVARVKSSLEAERNAHKETKAQIATFSELGDLEDIKAKLDKYPELEAAAKGKLDDAAIQEIVDRRVEGTLKTKISPLEREINQLKKTNGELSATNEQLVGKERQRTIHDDVRKQLSAMKVLPEAHEDALMLADRVFEIGEDGRVTTKDGVGVTPGIGADAWLQELQEKRPHWWPATVGGGSKGSGGNSFGSDNPWSASAWNVTKQAEFQKQHGAERATAAAKAAGSSIGATKPPSK